MDLFDSARSGLVLSIDEAIKSWAIQRANSSESEFRSQCFGAMDGLNKLQETLFDKSSPINSICHAWDLVIYAQQQENKRQVPCNEDKSEMPISREDYPAHWLNMHYGVIPGYLESYAREHPENLTHVKTSDLDLLFDNCKEKIETHRSVLDIHRWIDGSLRIVK